MRKSLLADLTQSITEMSADNKTFDNMIETIGKTYGDPATKVPRLELANLCFKISTAISRNSGPDAPRKVLLFAIKGLRSLGFSVEVNNFSNEEQTFNPCIISRWGVVTGQVLEALFFLAETSAEWHEYMCTAYQILLGMPYSEQMSRSRKIASRK